MTVLQASDLRLRVFPIRLRVDLVVIALQEDRPFVALAQGGGEHARRVLGRRLRRVDRLADGLLEDEELRVHLRRGAEDGPAGV